MILKFVWCLVFYLVIVFFPYCFETFTAHKTMRSGETKLWEAVPSHKILYPTVFPKTETCRVIHWIMFLCFSLKVIFQTQNHRNTPKWWTVCPETSVELCFQKSSFYFIGNVGICITCCFACWLPNWEQSCMQLLLTLGQFLFPLMPYIGIYCYRSLREGPQKPFPVFTSLDEGLHLAGSSLSLTEGRDPWALHKIFIWLENSMCYMCLFPDYLLIGILCSPVTALCLAGSWWNSPLPNLPRANFSMSAQV